MTTTMTQWILRGNIVIAAMILLQYVLWIDAPSLFRTMLTVTSVAILGYHSGLFLLPQTSRFFQIAIGTMSFLAALSILLSGVYWFFSLSKVFVSLALVFLGSIVLFLPKTKQAAKAIRRGDLLPMHSLPTLLVLLGDGILFLKLFEKRLGDTIISPWTFVGPKFFFTFFCVTTLLLFLLQQKKVHIALKGLMTVVHFVLFLSVALILYKHGFGFDPFIHQASEQWILSHGTITPKVPYYIGQYMLVLVGFFTTGLPLAMLDHLIVPLGTALSLPLMLSYVMKKKDAIPFFSIALVPLLPLSFFIVTTPHHLAILLSALTSTWIWHEFDTAKNIQDRSRIIGVLLVGATCVVHAFVGIPLAIIYLGSLLFQQKKKKTLFLIYAPVLIATLPIIFLFSLGPNTTLLNPLVSLSVFTDLFTQPHWYIGIDPNMFWKLLYGYKRLIIPGIIFCMTIELYQTRKQSMRALFFAVTAVSLFVCSFLIATTIWPPDLISYERGNYAKRLLELILALGIPALCACWQRFEIKQYTRPIIQLTVALCFSILLLISWYFTYPTRDPVSLYTGYAVRDADIATVHFIQDRQGENTNYIVLTNQVIGAAALGEFGFETYHTMQDGSEQYFYSIPTGAPLYQYFRKMVYEEPKRQWMEEAMNYAGVDTAYFVHTNTWAPAATIRDAAKKEANAWFDIGNGQLWIYEYTRE